MSRVKSSGNKSTEAAFITLMTERGITGWRRHLPIFGKPDFVFRKTRIAVFIDGCFWHGCPKHCRMPATNRDYWERKIGRNLERDKKVKRELRKAGWTVVRIWEHELKDGTVSRKLKRIAEVLQTT
ncbi:MAG: very short patch repair endonuclease [Verrucomicrobiia bacterium]